MDYEKIVSFVKQNKLLSLICLIFLIAVVFAAINEFGGFRHISYQNADVMDSSYMYDEGMLKSGANYAIMPRTDDMETSSDSYVEVKEGSMTIDTENAEKDAADIQALAEISEGYVEDVRKYENDYNLNINMMVRIPEADFSGFVDTLKERYDEKSFSVSFYRLSTQKETDELDILNSAFADYETLRNRTMEIALDENQIDLLFRITEKELEIKRLEKYYTSSLSGKQERSDHSTLRITLQEKKKISIMPEDLGDQLRLKIKRALSDIANSLMDIVTGGIVVFIYAIKYVIFFILIAIPLIFGYRVLKRIYGRITTLYKVDQ